MLLQKENIETIKLIPCTSCEIYKPEDVLLEGDNEEGLYCYDCIDKL